MTKRTVHSSCIIVAMMLAACSQGQGTSSATPDAPLYGTSTGELACDEYLSLARSCIDKGRFGAGSMRRTEIAVVERSLREAVAGSLLPIDRNAVWSSALVASQVANVSLRADRMHHSRHGEIHETTPPRELCKRGVDQLPLDCQ
jgi:hypothetical protein